LLRCNTAEYRWQALKPRKAGVKKSYFLRVFSHKNKFMMQDCGQGFLLSHYKKCQREAGIFSWRMAACYASAFNAAS
jgi:hypothetical protein